MATAHAFIVLDLKLSTHYIMVSFFLIFELQLKICIAPAVTSGTEWVRNLVTLHNGVQSFKGGFENFENAFACQGLTYVKF